VPPAGGRPSREQGPRAAKVVQSEHNIIDPLTGATMDIELNAANAPGLPGNMKSKQVCRVPNGANTVEFWHIYPHTLRTNATANEGRVGCWVWGAGHHHVCAGDRHGAYSVPVAPADGRFPRRGVFATGAPQGSPAPRQLALLIYFRTLLRPKVKLPFWFSFL